MAMSMPNGSALTGKGGQFGVHKFDIRVSTTYCIKACLFSFCILVPFLGLMFYLPGRPQQYGDAACD
jgi:uncharacterized membrane protein YjgN (DUF898 family)